MPDFHRISKRFQKGAASLEDVVRVYQANLLLPGLVTCLERGVEAEEDEDEAMQDGEADAGEKGVKREKRWKGLIEELWLSKLRVRSSAVSSSRCALLTFIPDDQDFEGNLAPYQEMVETTIDLSELSRHEFVIKADFDDSLRETRDRLEEVRDALNEEHLSVANDLGMDPEGKVLHFEVHSMYGHCFRLTRKVCSLRIPSAPVSHRLTAPARAGSVGNQGQERLHRTAEPDQWHVLHDQDSQVAQRREERSQEGVRQEAERARQGGDRHRV